MGIKDGLISTPVITDAEARKLRYLQACIKEGLRMWPPAAGFSTKVVPSGGDEYNGIHIPGGTEIADGTWGVRHSLDVYGEDVDLFVPERWLQTDGEKLARMERSIETVFGGGKYGSLGKNIALI